MDRYRSDRPARIKEQIPPDAFYQRECSTMPTPRRRGWVNGGLCPFHEDRSTGSFVVNINNGAYKCFSCGAGGGDVIAFLRQRDGSSFGETLVNLESAWGVR